MLKFIKPKEKKGDLRLAFQRSGKLGFSAQCNKEFDLENNRFAKFAFDDDGNLFIKILNKGEDETFKIKPISNYYNINIRSNISDFNLTFEDSVCFNLTKDKDGFYKMERQLYTSRINKRNNKIK